MAVDSVGSVANTNSSSTNNLQNAGVSQEDFLKILLAQLSFQDPLKPMDNQEFISQLAQFSSLEQTREFNDKTDTLLAFQTANQAIGLIGKQVQVTGSDGSITVGKVKEVSFNNGTPLLSLDSTPPLLNISLSQVSLIRDPTPSSSSSSP